MHKHHTVQTPSKASRVRTLAVALTALLVGASFYATNVRADDGCGVHSDFLIKSARLMAS